MLPLSEWWWRCGGRLGLERDAAVVAAAAITDVCICFSMASMLTSSPEAGEVREMVPLRAVSSPPNVEPTGSFMAAVKLGTAHTHATHGEAGFAHWFIVKYDF